MVTLAERMNRLLCEDVPGEQGLARYTGSGGGQVTPRERGAGQEVDEPRYTPNQLKRIAQEKADRMHILRRELEDGLVKVIKTALAFEGYRVSVSGAGRGRSYMIMYVTHVNNSRDLGQVRLDLSTFNIDSVLGGIKGIVDVLEKRKNTPQSKDDWRTPAEWVEEDDNEPSY